MASSKLTGSLLVYKDLPSAVTNQPTLSTANAADDLPQATRRPTTQVALRRRHGPRFGFALTGCSIAAVAAAALVFVIHTSSQTGTAATAPKIPVSANASPVEEVAVDRIAEFPSAPGIAAVAEWAAQPQPAPQAPIAAAEDNRLAAPAAPARSVADAKSVDVAAPPPRPATDVPVPSAEAQLPAEQLATLLTKGDRLFGAGDIVSARLFYQRAAEAGDARAALQLAESYDTTFLHLAGLTAVRGDAAAAVRWYERARRLGSVEAGILLRSIGASGEQAPAGERPADAGPLVDTMSAVLSAADQWPSPQQAAGLSQSRLVLSPR